MSRARTARLASHVRSIKRHVPPEFTTDWKALDRAADLLLAQEAHTEVVGTAMWAALDIVREHLGGFQYWPDALKHAFSLAMIDPDQTLTEADIRHGRELAAKHGWLISPSTGEPPSDAAVDPVDSNSSETSTREKKS